MLRLKKRKSRRDTKKEDHIDETSTTCADVRRSCHDLSFIRILDDVVFVKLSQYVDFVLIHLTMFVVR